MSLLAVAVQILYLSGAMQDGALRRERSKTNMGWAGRLV
jgi:hypothetical protein